MPALGALGERAAAAPWALSYASAEASDLARVLDELADAPERVVALGAAARAALDESGAGVGETGTRATTLAVHTERTLALLTRAIAAGAPTGIPPIDHAAEGARLVELDAWDAALGASDPHALGLA